MNMSDSDSQEMGKEADRLLKLWGATIDNVLKAMETLTNRKEI